MAESGKQYRDNLLEANEYARNLAQELLQVDGISESTRKKMSKMAEAMKGQADIGDQLNTLIQERQTFIDNEVAAGRRISDAALERVDAEIALLQKAKVNKDLQSDLKDTMYAQVGLSQDLVDKLVAGGVAALGLMILAKVVQFIGEATKRAIELNQQTGASAAQAAQYESNIRMAQFSVEGLLLGFDKLSASAGELVKLTGNLNISPDTIKGTAALNELLSEGGSAASLQRTFEGISSDTDAFRESIKDVATDSGMSAQVVFDALADNSLRLLNASESEAKVLAQQAVTIKQMGVDRKKSLDLAGQALDLESSLANEIKLRQVLGKNISFEELRRAQASGDEFEVAKARNALAMQLKDVDMGNAQIRRMIAETTGIEADELTNIVNSSRENRDITRESAEAEADKAGFLDKNLGLITNIGIALAAVAAGFLVLKGIGKFMGGMGKTNPIAKFIQGFGNPKVLMGAAAMALISSSVLLLGLGFKQFMEVEWSAMGKAGVAILALTAAMFGLGALLTGPGAIIFGAGVAGFIALGAAMTVLGVGIMSMATGIDMLSGLTDVLTPLTGLAQGLLILAPSFAAFGLSLIPLALGLAAITPFLPTLLALGATGAILGSIFGGGGESAGDSAGGGTGGGSELLDEIKGLRSDIQSQPILIQVDGKVVSEITKSQLKQSSFSRQMGR